MEKIKRAIREPVFRHSCLSALVICLLAHGFTYTNLSFFHDRWAYSMQISFTSAARAKWMAQYFDALTGFAYLPWLFGVWVIVFFAISVYFAARVLRLHTPLSVWLLSGIWITCVNVINAHLYWPQEILAALPFAMASAWVWNQEKMPLPARVSLAAVLVGFSLASYGAYTSAVLCVVIIALAAALLDGVPWKTVFLRGLEYVVEYLGGMAFYYIVLRLFLHFQKIGLLSYMGEDRLMGDFPSISELLIWAVTGYKESLKYLISEPSFRVLLLVGVCLALVQAVRARHRLKSPMTLLLMAFLIVALPLCAGSIHVMAFGGVHHLMTFSYGMPLIAVIVLADREWHCASGQESGTGGAKRLWTAAGEAAVFGAAAWAVCRCGEALRVVYPCIAAAAAVCAAGHLLVNGGLQKHGRAGSTPAGQEHAKTNTGNAIFAVLAAVCFVFTIYQGIVLSNETYLWADRIDVKTKSLSTRVLTQIESCEGYTGREKVVFVGQIMMNEYLRASFWDEDLYVHVSKTFIGRMIHGFTQNDLLLFQSSTVQQLDLYNYVKDDFTQQENEQIEQMPQYPEDGSIRMIGDTVVVKFSAPLW